MKRYKIASKLFNLSTRRLPWLVILLEKKFP